MNAVLLSIAPTSYFEDQDQIKPTDTDGNPLVNISGYAGDSGAGHNILNNAMTQINRVTAVAGNVLTLEMPLYINFANAPKVYKLPNMVEHCGVENLRISLVDPYMGEYHNSLPENDTHGAHPFMNLWEGNDAPNLEFDFAHGSSSNNSVFRNYFNLICTNPDTGRLMTGGIWAINIADYSNYDNVVGNVLGPSVSTDTAMSYEVQAGYCTNCGNL